MTKNDTLHKYMYIYMSIYVYIWHNLSNNTYVTHMFIYVFYVYLPLPCVVPVVVCPGMSTHHLQLKLAQISTA